MHGHRVIVRPAEQTGPRTYCYCGWASARTDDHDAMVREVVAHLPLRDRPVAAPLLRRPTADQEEKR